MKKQPKNPPYLGPTRDVGPEVFNLITKPAGRMKWRDLIGETIGDRFVHGFVGMYNGTTPMFLVECKCSNLDVVQGGNLRHGMASRCQSCAKAARRLGSATATVSPETVRETPAETLTKHVNDGDHSAVEPSGVREAQEDVNGALPASLSVLGGPAEHESDVEGLRRKAAALLALADAREAMARAEAEYRRVVGVVA